MAKKRRPALELFMEAVPDQEYEEHLRKVFAILARTITRELDETNNGRQDESIVARQS